MARRKPTDEDYVPGQLHAVPIDEDEPSHDGARDTASPISDHLPTAYDDMAALEADDLEREIQAEVAAQTLAAKSKTAPHPGIIDTASDTMSTYSHTNAHARAAHGQSASHPPTPLDLSLPPRPPPPTGDRILKPPKVSTTFLSAFQRELAGLPKKPLM